MSGNIKDCTELNNGLNMPWLGFGVYQINEGQDVYEAVQYAFKTGYRSIDTATIYGNEQGVGRAVRECGIPREEIFITTKVWNDDQRNNRTMQTFEESLERLQMDYVDLYLLHWPVKDCYQKSWRVLEEIYQSGRAKAIGVSNFMISHLEVLLSDCQIVPSVNQIEFHPCLVQPDLLKFCQSNNIQVEAWSPLMRGEISNIQLIQELAEKYQKSSAQIVLRWNLQHSVVTIPKSAQSHRIVENAQLFDYELSQEDMNALDSLDVGKRIGPDPYNFNF